MFTFLKNLLILPFNVLFTIPYILIYLNKNQLFENYYYYYFIIGILIFIIGISLFIRCVLLFFKFGNGTIAPWNPPKNFIIKGPYKYVRHPMIIGVNLILVSEFLILNSLIIILWNLFFFVINVLYLKYVEEEKLISRFGISYKEYKKNVHPWIPKIKPYSTNK